TRDACASPDYLARHGTPQIPADLAQHNCLAFLFANGPEREWRFPRPDRQGAEVVVVRGRLDVNGGMALREAALAGLGVILQPELMLKDDIESGRLVRLFPNWPAATWPVHVMHLPDARITPKLESFVSFLRETLGR